MFIRYKCTGSPCYFYDKDGNCINSIEADDSSFMLTDYSSFVISEKDIEYFKFQDVAKHKLSNYELNKNYYFNDKKITLIFSAILKKEQKTEYYYKNKNLFKYFEAPNVFPNSGDSIFRMNYFLNKDKKVYLSKYDPDYYPVLSVSPPNFIFNAGKYEYTSDGEASKLYEAFKYQDGIPKTLFLKPYCRQWNRGRVLLTNPGEYNCTYDYNVQKLTINGVDYYNVPHVITICCQGGGRGGENGKSMHSGEGGSAGGFIAVNCFLGKQVENIKIKVGKGGGSEEDGEPSFVQIDQIVDLESTWNEKNPTFISYNELEYTKLENSLSIIAEGGTRYTEGKFNDIIIRKPGNGIVNATTTGYYKNKDSNIESHEKSELSSLFYKILFKAEGGKGGNSIPLQITTSWDGGIIYLPPNDGHISNATGSGVHFNAIIDSETQPNLKTTWSSNNTYLLERKNPSYNSNPLDSPLILGGSSLKESLYSNNPSILPVYGNGGKPVDFNPYFPSGGGGGGSLFGDGGIGNWNSVPLGAGGGGGKGGNSEYWSGGKGGDGAVWLIW